MPNYTGSWTRAQQMQAIAAGTYLAVKTSSQKVRAIRRVAV